MARINFSRLWKSRNELIDKIGRIPAIVNKSTILVMNDAGKTSKWEYKNAIRSNLFQSSAPQAESKKTEVDAFILNGVHGSAVRPVNNYKKNDQLASYMWANKKLQKIYRSHGVDLKNDKFYNGVHFLSLKANSTPGANFYGKTAAKALEKTDRVPNYFNNNNTTFTMSSEE